MSHLGSWKNWDLYQTGCRFSNFATEPFEFQYDDHNSLIKAIDPTGKFVATDYNSDELPVKSVDAEGRVVFFHYDSEMRLVRTTDGAGNETTYHYDETSAVHAQSHLPVRIDYPTYSRRLYYDRLQRLVATTDVLEEGNIFVCHTANTLFTASMFSPKRKMYRRRNDRVLINSRSKMKQTEGPV